MQEEQADCVQPVHLSDPPTGMEIPSESLDRQLNVEKSFCPLALHVGQKASSLTRFIERSSSNLLWQLGQKYS